jgi:hypothetical protein
LRSNRETAEREIRRMLARMGRRPKPLRDVEVTHHSPSDLYVVYFICHDGSRWCTTFPDDRVGGTIHPLDDAEFVRASREDLVDPTPIRPLSPISRSTSEKRKAARRAFTLSRLVWAATWPVTSARQL